MLTTPSRVFLLLGALSGLLFLIGTPPSRFPDEPGHYLRAASVAQHLFDAGSDPSDITQLPPLIAEKFDYLRFRASDVASGHPFTLGEIAGASRSPIPIRVKAWPGACRRRR